MTDIENDDQGVPKMRADACRWPEERIEQIRLLADALTREGDLVNASTLLYGVIPVIEGWPTMMEVIAESSGRRVLRDHSGDTWVAVPLGDVRLDRFGSPSRWRGPGVPGGSGQVPAPSAERVQPGDTPD
ncbi:hypothetical protein [Nocardioides sp. ChNu-99]|uniref:hypothetical protein n=1 Tax=Nocardioides sp. ChNu-99 TaxID=2839897 RepID=UPI0024051CD0|nr:hypothetical protein [Nocardioides sp. ChNu-99]MDF9716474.1 hypothetical protein [Nocardioides sp. ChNu-99]